MINSSKSSDHQTENPRQNNNPQREQRQRSKPENNEQIKPLDNDRIKGNWVINLQ